MKTIGAVFLMGSALWAQAGLATTNWVQAQGFSTSGGSLPSGIIVMIVSGTCPTGWSEATALNGKMLRGTLAANGDVGTTGGNATITPSGSVSAPTFTGTSSQITSATSAGTPAGTNSTVAFTPAGTNSVPTFTGSALATHTHTFTGTLATASATTSTPKLVTANTSTGVAPQLTATGTNAAISAGTPAGTVSAPTFTGSAGTIPAETFTGSALATHTHTLTPAGTVSAPTFTGDAVDPSPSYTKVIFCAKN